MRGKKEKHESLVVPAWIQKSSRERILSGSVVFGTKNQTAAYATKSTYCLARAITVNKARVLMELTSINEWWLLINTHTIQSLLWPELNGAEDVFDLDGCHEFSR